MYVRETVECKDGPVEAILEQSGCFEACAKRAAPKNNYIHNTS